MWVGRGGGGGVEPQTFRLLLQWLNPLGLTKHLVWVGRGGGGGGGFEPQTFRLLLQWLNPLGHTLFLVNFQT